MSLRHGASRHSPHAPLHAWPAAVLGLAAGVAVLVYFPQLHAVSASLILFAGFHIAGLSLIAASALLAWRNRRSSSGQTGAVRWAWLNGPLLAAVAVGSAAVALQVSRPHLWWIANALWVQATFFLVGSRLLGELRSPHAALLPMVDLPLGPQMRVLDLGCGGGRSTRAIAALGASRIIAFDDFDPKHPHGDDLRKALDEDGLGDRVEIATGALDQTPFPTATFDVVVSIDVYDHRGAPPEQALHEMARLLRPGGRLLLGVRTPSWRSFAVVHALALRLPSRARWRRAAARAQLRTLAEIDAQGRWWLLADLMT